MGMSTPKTFIQSFSIGVCLLVALPVSANSDIKKPPHITWEVSHFPPANIVDGPFAGEGFADQTRRYFQTALTQYSHGDVNVSFAESMEHFKTADHLICRADLLKTPEREKTIIFSKPAYFMSGHRLIVANHKFAPIRKLLGKNGDLDIVPLLEQNDLSISYVSGRSYFSESLPAFENYKAKYPNMDNKSSSAAIIRLVRGEADAIIAYPWEFTYYQKNEKVLKKFRSVQLSLTAPIMYGHFGCSKTEQGAAVISEINKIIEKFYGIPPWIKFYQEWVPADEAARVERAYLHFVNKVTSQ